MQRWWARDPARSRSLRGDWHYGKALSHHADEAFNALDERGKSIARRVFQRLSDWGMDNRETRRPTRLSEFCAVTEASEAEVVLVIDQFRTGARTFLTPPANETLRADSVVDISHESLIRLWDRLRQWARDEAESSSLYRRLADAAVRHREGKAALWRDPDLQLALDWQKREAPNQAWAARDDPNFAAAAEFIKASVAAETARLEREHQAERQRVELLKRIQITQSRFLASLSQQETEAGNGTNGILLALEALPADTDMQERPYVAEAELALFRGVQENRELQELEGHTGSIGRAAFSPDGRRIVTASSDQTARVWDAASGRSLALLHGHTDAVNSATFSADGSRIVTASDDQTARVWDAASGRSLALLQGHTDAVRSATFSADGARIVTASSDQTARVWRIFPNTRSLIDYARAHVPRQLTPEQCRAFFVDSDTDEP